MTDETSYLSKQLAYSLAGISVLLAVSQITITMITGLHPPHYNPVVEAVVFFFSLVLVPASLYFAIKNAGAKLLALIAVHIMLGIYLIWYSEAFSPFIPLMSMAILVTSLYYGWKGFIASSLFLLFASTTYCIVFFDDLSFDPGIYIPLSILLYIMTVFTSSMFVRIIVDSQKKNHELLKTRQSELLQVNRLNTLINSISDAVMTLNRYGRVTSQNAAAQAFFDTNESLVGRDIDKMLELKDLTNQPVSAHSLIANTKSITLREDLSTGEGGDTRHLSIQMSRIKSTFDDSEEYGVVLIIRDITKQKSLEEEKDEFISVTSHELRTPVAIAEGSLSNLIVMGERGADPSKLRDAAKMAHEQVVYLARMINDLSTLSRAERSVGDTIEPIDVNSLVHDMYIKYTPEAQSKSLMLDLEVEPNLPQVATSRLYLEEILENFVTNALKYTKSGTITIIAKNESENAIRFAVRDTGIGMSKSDLDHIFEKFYRSEDYRTRETSGTGLGLYVVSKLATKLETHIEVESRLNHGSEFSFVLPVQSEKLAIAEAANPDSPSVAVAPTLPAQESPAPAEQSASAQ